MSRGWLVLLLWAVALGPAWAAGPPVGRFQQPDRSFFGAWDVVYNIPPDLHPRDLLWLWRNGRIVGEAAVVAVSGRSVVVLPNGVQPQPGDSVSFERAGAAVPDEEQLPADETAAAPAPQPSALVPDSGLSYNPIDDVPFVLGQTDWDWTNAFNDTYGYPYYEHRHGHDYVCYRGGWDRAGHWRGPRRVVEPQRRFAAAPGGRRMALNGRQDTGSFGHRGVAFHAGPGRAGVALHAGPGRAGVWNRARVVERSHARHAAARHAQARPARRAAFHATYRGGGHAHGGGHHGGGHAHGGGHRR